jgi:hypothetical protein
VLNLQGYVDLTKSQVKRSFLVGFDHKQKCGYILSLITGWLYFTSCMQKMFSERSETERKQFVCQVTNIR